MERSYLRDFDVEIGSLGITENLGLFASPRLNFAIKLAYPSKIRNRGSYCWLSRSISTSRYSLTSFILATLPDKMFK